MKVITDIQMGVLSLWLAASLLSGHPDSLDLSTPFHKYDDVCWERDGDQIEAKRRVNVGTLARRRNEEMGAVVAGLARKELRYSTGSIITVDRGLTVRTL